MTQKIESFTVAILDNNTTKPVGTGFVVTGTYIVTAYHVIASALHLGERLASSEDTVRLRFPSIMHENSAEIVPEYSNPDYDIATLQVDRLPPKVGIAVLGPSVNSTGDRFISTGYREVSGGAIGFIAPPELEPSRLPYPQLILHSDQIDKGMSGAPILDLEQDRVVGMVMATWYSRSTSGKDRDTSFATPSETIKEICPFVRLIPPYRDLIYSIVRPKGLILENLPPKRKLFIGRLDEKQLVVDLLTPEAAKVILTGMGGMGKTALALEVAYECISKELFGIAVWIDGVPELTLSRMLDTIAEEINFAGYKTLNDAEKKAKLRQLLRAEPCLLIVDGYENLQDKTIEEFLDRLPRQCRLLITSRHTEKLSDREIVSIRKLNASEGEELLRARSHGKRLERAEPPVFQELYKVCGGLPLALEWAVGQINSGRQTLQAITHSLTKAKTEGLYSGLFESSYLGFTDAEKRILWVIIVSVGNVSKRALVYVTRLTEEEIDVALGQLIDLSLVYENGEFEDKKIRFSIHPLLSNFLRIKLYQQPKSFSEEYITRYIHYFSDLAEHSEYSELDLADIRITLDWFNKHDPKRFIELIYALSYYFYNEGLWNERIFRAQQALDASKRISDRKSEAWMLINELGYMSVQRGDYDIAETYIRSGLEITKEKVDALRKTAELTKDTEDKFGFQFMMGLALRYLGILYSHRSQFPEANRFFSDALKVFEHLQRNSIIANQKIEMAEFALKAGNILEAQNLYSEAIDYHATQQDDKPYVLPWMARAYYGLGDVRLQEGNLAEARSMCLKSLELANARRSESEIAYAKYRLASVDEREQNYAGAIGYLEDAIKIFVRLGNMDLISNIEVRLAKLKNL